MIHKIDETLRTILVDEIHKEIKNKVDVQFEAPRRAWASRLQDKPTINLFLFDIRENLRLRRSEQNYAETRKDGKVVVHRNPVRIDLRYLMTAWAENAVDEHQLLSTALIILMRHPFLNKELLMEGQSGDAFPIPLEIATFMPEAGPVDKFSELWGVLDNEIRPGVLVTVTYSLDPYDPMSFSTPSKREVRWREDFPGPAEAVSEPKPLKEFCRVVGSITRKSKTYEKTEMSELLVTVKETKHSVEPQRNGVFVLGLAKGAYHLDVTLKESRNVIESRTIDVPIDSLEIEI